MNTVINKELMMKSNDVFLNRFSEQLEDPDVNQQLRAVGGLIACGELRAYALLLNTRLLEGTLLHRAVECAFIKKNATEWLGLFNADETEWKRLLESKQPILFDAIESRYVQQRIMGILSQGGCQLPEKLLMRYFAVSDKDSEAYEQALLLVERHDGSADFKTFKKYLNERLQCARDLQIVACVKGLSSRLESVRLQSVVMLVNLGDSSTVEPLIGTLADEHELVRVFAVKALVRIGDPRAVQPLISLLCDSEERVRREAAAALEFRHQHNPPQHDELFNTLQAVNAELIDLLWCVPLSNGHHN